MDETLVIFIGKLEELIEVIDLLTEAIVKNKDYAAKRIMPVFTELLMEVVPIIIDSYELPQLEEVAEDAIYWQGQVERIMNALEGEDWFAMVDVLHFETKENLMTYKQMIEKAEIAL